MSLEYLQKITSEQLTKVKNDFTKNKTFKVSQTIVGGGGKKVDSDYESAL